MEVNAKIQKAVRELSFFQYQDMSSEESIRIGNKEFVTTENWNEISTQFIQERFSRKKYSAWNWAEWAKHELKLLNSIDFEDLDRQVLKERYSIELKRIMRGGFMEKQSLLSFICQEAKRPMLRKLHEILKKENYIEAKWKEFEQLFIGMEASMIRQIKWKATQWELALCIELLLQKELIVKCNHIKITCILFMGKNGKPLKEDSFKSQASEAKKKVAGNAAKHEKMEDIFRCLA